MKALARLSLACLLAAGCAGAREIYKDEYDPRKAVYVNEALGFSLTFDEGWRIYAHTASMPTQIRQVAESFEEKGAEFIFYGVMPSNNIVFARAMVEETDLPLNDYFNIVHRINTGEFNHIYHKVDRIGGKEMVKWIYMVNDDRITFQEYQVKQERYNIRLSFWTFTNRFEEYKDDFERIAGSFQTALVKNLPEPQP